MATDFTAADLRALAGALDALSAATRTTGVRMYGYSGEAQFQLNGHPMHISWKDGEPPAETMGGRTPHEDGGQYVVEIPDITW